jgi:hypothetical protein
MTVPVPPELAERLRGFLLERLAAGRRPAPPDGEAAGRQG